MNVSVHATHPSLNCVRGSLLGVLLISLVLNLWNNDFPLGYHFDESKKVEFVLNGRQDFHHPILMLQIVRAIRYSVGSSDHWRVAMLGRTIVAVCGVAAVWATYMLAREVVSHYISLLACLLVAVCPTMVVHAHYFKEDILLTMWLLISLLAFIAVIRKLTIGNAFVLGVSIGLACSSHYKAIIVVAIYALFPLFGPVERLRRYYLYGSFALAVAVAMFLAVNAPLFVAPEIALNGAMHEFQHATAGHTLHVSPLSYGFAFHFVFSLVPGMTPLCAGLAGIAVISGAMRWSLADWKERLLLVYSAVYYGIIELSPLKPEPDYARYTVNFVPVLMILVAMLLGRLWNVGRAGRIVSTTLAVSCMLMQCVDTILLDAHLVSDTRKEAEAYVAVNSPDVLRECYTGSTWDVQSLTDLDVDAERDRGVSFLVASSFQYERYFRGSTLDGQDPDVYRRYNGYERLFRCPYVEIAPAYRTFAFSNPVIRVIDIRCGSTVNCPQE